MCLVDQDEAGRSVEEGGERSREGAREARPPRRRNSGCGGRSALAYSVCTVDSDAGAEFKVKVRGTG